MNKTLQKVTVLKFITVTECIIIQFYLLRFFLMFLSEKYNLKSNSLYHLD